ncbi:hypothetical protein EUX98_g1625 [Antrodiella citrinella]|uniref:F-box domain-containing protein n=1 Tax=Antrodiella citrinella TaxID=2447956 RepID=A0A4S4N108_9APHY|nr:hypothetical protein EUX98_g1625 [Antrodiella citrinella]
MAPAATLSCLRYPEPPTKTSLEAARQELATQNAVAKELNNKIQAAEEDLARLIQQSRCAIKQMEKEKEAVEEDMAQMLAYVSPIKRLPHELLRHIFYMNFEDYPCCAWVLAAVCKLWLDFIHLPFVLRDGHAAYRSSWAFYLEYVLKLVIDSTGNNARLFRRYYPPMAGAFRTKHATGHRDIPQVLQHPGQRPTYTQTPYIQQHTGRLGDAMDRSYMDSAAATRARRSEHCARCLTSSVMLSSGTVIPLALPAQAFDSMMIPAPADRSNSATPQAKSRASIHWGYIAFYYLTEQMHRWERFVFRFDKKFSSIAALKHLAGDAPLLKEFEISCAEPTFANDWSWLPCAKPTSSYHIPQLQSLTLQYVPFKWSAPILTNLRNLSLRTLPTTHIALDRILYLISQSPDLENLSLCFTAVNPAVLPLMPTTLSQLKSFSIGGHYLLNTLVDSMSFPALQALTIDVDGRDPVEDTISNLFARSNSPPLATLSLAYGTTGTTSGGIYYATGSMITSWHFLRDLDHISTLQVGGIGFETFLSALTFPDDENGAEQWLCPNLTTLAMRNCHLHGDGVSKLVQMIEARNPDTGAGHAAVAVAGVVPARMKRLGLMKLCVVNLHLRAAPEVRINTVIYECTL